MHGTRTPIHGRPERPAGELPQPADTRRRGRVIVDLEEPLHGAPVELDLIDRLPRPDLAQLRRPIRRQDEQRHPRLVRLDHRRRVVRRRRPRRARQRHRQPRGLRQPQGEERRAALVDVRRRAQAPVPRQRQDQGRRSRPRRRAGVAHPTARELIDEGTKAEVGVSSGHDLLRCSRRSSCCMASRRPARAGGERPGRSQELIERSRRTCLATARRPPGHRASTPARPTSARSIRRSWSATAWAGGSPSTSRPQLDTTRPARTGRREPRTGRPRRTRGTPHGGRSAGDAAREHGHRGVRPRVGLPAAFPEPARARGGRRLRRPAEKHAARPRASAEGPWHRRHGAAVGPAHHHQHPRNPDHRRARREIPRHRRADARAATERDTTSSSQTPATPPSSNSPSFASAIKAG